MAKRPERKEPSYQIGIPIDGPESSALQRADPYDHEETAQDYMPPPASADHPSTEVALPQTITFAPDPEPPPEPPSAPTTEVSLAPPPPAPPPPAARARASRSGPPPPPPPQSASGRSSRRTAAAASGRAPVSSRRLLPVDRGAWQRSLIWVGLGLLLGVVAVGAVIVLARRESPDRQAAVQALAEAGHLAELARGAIANRRAAEARKAYDAAMAALTATPQLGGAVEQPPEEPPVVRELALQAAALRGEVEPLAGRIAALEREAQAEGGLAALRTRVAAATDPATDLDQLERDLLAYIANPVDPRSGPSGANAAAFPRQVADANLRLPQIVTERERRRVARTVLPVQQASGEVDPLIQQERYGDALARLDALAKQNPEADFGQLRLRVEDAAAKSWRSARAQFDNRIADWRSPGATESQRKASLAAAKERMNQVIQRFGMPQYADQARALLVPLP